MSSKEVPAGARIAQFFVVTDDTAAFEHTQRTQAGVLRLDPILRMSWLLIELLFNVPVITPEPDPLAIGPYKMLAALLRLSSLPGQLYTKTILILFLCCYTSASLIFGSQSHRYLLATADSGLLHGHAHSAISLVCVCSL